MRPNSARQSYCSFVCIILLAFGPFKATLGYDYESHEEEPIQPNRLDEASSNFACNSDGYFADVTYGCQYYHVCEIANNPYDKPSFVKHTFSCVNGTIFNQMSFTCTRHEDSIPCEASPNYFYLNKRNGDPKAFFLTDEDMAKSGIKQANHAAKLNSYVMPRRQPVIDQTPTRYEPRNIPKASSPITIRHHAQEDDIETNLAKIKPSINYVHNGVPQQSNSESHSSTYNQKNTAPYEMNYKYYSDTVKPGVKYVSKSKSYISKAPKNYEPMTTNYISRDVSVPQADSHQKYAPKANRSTMLQYQSLLSSFAPANSKIDQMLVNNDNAVDDNSKSGYAYASTAVTPQPLRKSTFTPASFSRMYIESQKAARYSPETPKYPPKQSTNKDYFKSIPDSRKPKYNGHNNNIPAQTSNRPSSNRLPYSTVSNKVTATSNSFIPSSKYSQLTPTSGYEQIKSNQYVVPSSIRIIEPNNQQSQTNQNSRYTQLSNDASDTATTQPVKISFVNNNGQSNSASGYDNFKVVKQVKGKNLLIDPSLENDPARDNIIAQVLEMLSKYN